MTATTATAPRVVPPWGPDLRNGLVARHPTAVAAVIWALVAGTGTGLIAPVDTSSLVASTGSRVGAVFAAGALGAVLLLTPKALGALADLLTSSVPLLALCGLATLSVLWADEVAQSAQGIVRLGAGALVAAALARRIPLRSIVVSLYGVTGLSSAIAVALTVVAPGTVRTPLGVWHGLYGWNSTAGLVAAVGVLIGSFAPRPYVPIGPARYVLLVSSVLALWLSASRTAQISVVAGMLFVVAFRLFRRDSSIVIVIVSLYGLAALAVSNALRFALLDVLGKDATLTDRANIWSVVVDEIALRPLIGWGWRSYWFSERADQEFATFFRIPQHSHNQFLEVALQIGVPGGLLLVVIVWQLGAALLRLGGPAADRPDVVDAADAGESWRADAALAPMLFGLYGLLVTQTTANAFLLQNTAFSVLFLVLIAVVPRSSLPLRRPAVAPSSHGGASR